MRKDREVYAVDHDGQIVFFANLVQFAILLPCETEVIQVVEDYLRIVNHVLSLFFCITIQYNWAI